ncbi:MAG: TrkH family potassium uptake protein [Pseudomonadota bacterium]
MDLRAVLLAMGIMTALLGLAMVPSAVLDVIDGRSDWGIFAMSAFLAILAGGVVYMLTRGNRPPRTGQREAFLLTVLVWAVLPLVAAVPFIGSGMGFTNAMFESISGLTTTGATVMTGLDDQPRGLLLWRAILQWIGGIGIIVTAIAILPGLRVGGMQLFQLESSDQSGKFLPRVADIAAQTGFVYLILSALCALGYLSAGMGSFDAVAHAMTTVAAGGYSTHDASFRVFADSGAMYVAMVFMFAAGLPFSLLALALLRGRPARLFTDSQPRLYAILLIVFTALVVTLARQQDAVPFEGDADLLSHALFNVISIMTGTGYASADYDLWGDPVVICFLVLTFLGGCAGSAACGIKMFRLEISIKAVMAHAQRVIRPHQLAPVRYNGRVVDEDTLQSVMVFVWLYVGTFLIAAVLIGTQVDDPLTAISAAATSVSNVGPGLGAEIGPNGTFQTLSVFAKWVCAIAMLLGRLEFIAVFVVLSRRFWQG